MQILIKFDEIQIADGTVTFYLDGEAICGMPVEGYTGSPDLTLTITGIRGEMDGETEQVFKDERTGR